MAGSTALGTVYNAAVLPSRASKAAIELAVLNFHGQETPGGRLVDSRPGAVLGEELGLIDLKAPHASRSLPLRVALSYSIDQRGLLPFNRCQNPRDADRGRAGAEADLDGNVGVLEAGPGLTTGQVDGAVLGLREGFLQCLDVVGQEAPVVVTLVLVNVTTEQAPVTLGDQLDAHGDAVLLGTRQVSRRAVWSKTVVVNCQQKTRRVEQMWI